MEKKRGRARFDRINEISCIDEDAASEVGCVRHKKKRIVLLPHGTGDMA